MDYEQATRDYAKAKGWAWPLKPSQHREAMMAIRPAKQLVADAARAVASRISTDVIRLKLTPEHIRQRHEKICDNCPSGKLDVLANGERVCLACNCSSKWLRSKLRNPNEACKLGHWDNAKAIIDDARGG